jgi:hypothetical protein
MYGVKVVCVFEVYERVYGVPLRIYVMVSIIEAELLYPRAYMVRLMCVLAVNVMVSIIGAELL